MNELKFLKKESKDKNELKVDYILEEENFKHIIISFIKIKEKSGNYFHVNTKLLMENFEDKGMVINLEDDKIQLFEDGIKVFFVLDFINEKININIHSVTNNLFDSELFCINKDKDKYFYIDKKNQQNFEINKENKDIFSILNDENLDKNLFFIKGMYLFTKIELFETLLENLKNITEEQIIIDKKIFDLAKEAFNFFSNENQKIINKNLKNK